MPKQPTPQPTPTNGHFSIWKLQFNLATVIQIAGLIAILVAGWYDLKTSYEHHSRNDWSQRDDNDYMHSYSTINDLKCPPHRRVGEGGRTDNSTN